MRCQQHGSAQCLLYVEQHIYQPCLRSASAGAMGRQQRTRPGLMVSTLEDLLLRYSNGRARLRQLLLEYLDNCSLRKLRLVSRVLHNLIGMYPYRMYEHLHVSAPWCDHIDTRSLAAVAPFCRNLTVKVGYEKAHSELGSRRLLQRQRPNSEPYSVNEANLSTRERWRKVRKALAISSRKSSPSSAALSFDQISATTQSTTSSKQPATSEMLRTSERHVWIIFLSRCERLQSITVSTNGKRGWPGKTHVEDVLIDFRVALEIVHLPHVRCVRFTPVHAMGIAHLRWSGFGAFGALAVKPSNVWSDLHTLDMQLENPFLSKHGLSEPQQVMFRKIFYHYLLSFAETLKCLQFIWLGEDGPSPMTLDLEPGIEGCRQAIVWTALEEVSLGNILLPHRTIRLLPERIAKVGVRLKTLRSTFQHSPFKWDDDDAWVEVLLDFTPHDIQ
jgi:hypothetical protein